MRKPITPLVFTLLAPLGVLWLALGAGEALADDTVCEMRSAYDRGVGVPPDACPPRHRKQAGLCYPKCRSGYDGVGPVCWKRCKSGYHDDGAFCRRDVSIIAADNRACPWYDMCGLTFARGCSTCPGGYVNDGCTCRRDAHIYAKQSYGRGVGQPMICRDGHEADAGLCYPLCDEGFDGVAFMCNPTCPPDAPVSCGEGICASEARFCAHGWPYARWDAWEGTSRAEKPVVALMDVWHRPPTDPRRPTGPDGFAGVRAARAEIAGFERPSPAERAFADRVADIAAAHGYRTDAAEEVAARVFDRVDAFRSIDWEELTELDILVLVDRFSPPFCWDHEDMPPRLLRVEVEREPGDDAPYGGDRFVWSHDGTVGDDALSIADRDGDGMPDGRDGCPDHGNKIAPGACGCDLADEADRDGDGASDCYGTVTINPAALSGWRRVRLNGVWHDAETTAAFPIGTEVEAWGVLDWSDVFVDGVQCHGRDMGAPCRFVVEGDVVVHAP